jgi:o-succinylbenzoate---CoA ligase
MSFYIKTIHQTVSKSDILAFSGKLNTFLINRGIAAPIIGITANTDPQTVLLMSACFIAGVPFVSLNPNLDDEADRKHINDIIPVSFWIASEANNVDAFELSSFLKQIQELPESDPIYINHSLPSLYLSTSGSTGEPKWLGFDCDQLQSAADASKQLLKPSSDGAWLLNLPLYHAGGLGVLIRSILWDTPVFVDPRKDASSIIDMIREYPEIENISVVPTQMHRILSGNATDPLLKLNTILVGAGSLSSKDLEQVNKIKLPVRQSYGMTESFGHVIVSPKANEYPLQAYNCGTPVPSISIEIRPDSSSSIGDSRKGLIWIKGPQVAKSYVRQTSDTFKGGWLNTQDYGYLNDMGQLIFEGRAHQIIKSGGVSISALKVEEALRRIPAIQDVAVLGIEDTIWGERVHACLIFDAIEHPNTSEIKSQLLGTLINIEIPKTISIHHHLPRTELGKVNYPQLRDILQDYSVENL